MVVPGEGNVVCPHRDEAAAASRAREFEAAWWAKRPDSFQVGWTGAEVIGLPYMHPGRSRWGGPLLPESGIDGVVRCARAEHISGRSRR